jgi:hypothetical protein
MECIWFEKGLCEHWIHQGKEVQCTACDCELYKDFDDFTDESVNTVEDIT